MNGTTSNLTKDYLLQTRKRIGKSVDHTPLLKSRLLNEFTGRSLFFKCENFQRAGSFKIRGVTHVLSRESRPKLSNGIATHSSGNHAQAVALAAQQNQIPAHIVMPENAAPPKIAAVRDYGAAIYFCGPTIEDRETKIEEIIRQTGAYFIHPYDDERIIAGQASVTFEIMDDMASTLPDLIITPLGGGGLTSGALMAASTFQNGPDVIGVEPEQADDAVASLRQDSIQPARNLPTIADGLKTSLGELTFDIIKNRITDIVTVQETTIIQAMRLIWERLKIVVEPSAAVPLACLLQHNLPKHYQTVALVCSGGNLDLDNLPW